MPPIRRVLVLAVDGAESLDVLGPVEVFCYADRQVPARTASTWSAPPPTARSR